MVGGNECCLLCCLCWGSWFYLPRYLALPKYYLGRQVALVHCQPKAPKASEHNMNYYQPHRAVHTGHLPILHFHASSHLQHKRAVVAKGDEDFDVPMAT